MTIDAERCIELLAPLPLILPWQHPDTNSSWHLYVVQPDPTRTRVNRLRLYHGLRERQIHAQVHYIPVHTQPWYRDLGFKPGNFPVAEHYYSGALSLPLYPDLTDEEQTRVVAALQALFAA